MKIPFLARWKDELSAPRPLSARDGDACARLHATGFAHSWSTQEFEALLMDSGCRGSGIDVKAGLAGFVISRRALDEAEILTIVVDPRMRGRGAGRRLLLAHLPDLAAQGVNTLFLEVSEANLAAVALYRRLGFVETGLRKGYYARPEGGRANALVMRRVIE